MVLRVSTTRINHNGTRKLKPTKPKEQNSKYNNKQKYKYNKTSLQKKKQKSKKKSQQTVATSMEGADARRWRGSGRCMILITHMWVRER